MLWPQNFKKYNLLCWDEEDFCLGARGVGYLQMGRVRIRKKKEKWGRRVSKEWPYIHFFRRPHRRNNTVGNSDGKSTRHRTDLLFKSLGDSVGIFDGTPVTSPIRIWHFKFVGDSIGIFNGAMVTSPVWIWHFKSVGDSIGIVDGEPVRSHV